jgi:glutamine---fructose-6-phosphate transaminase (isomerizing)
MCGIIGYAGLREAAPLLIAGLKRLEYRGYDSAGLAVMDAHSAVQVARAKGKVAALEAYVQTYPVQGSVGMAHTRWATHGAPEERNAHPHRTADVAIVHNGIIENYAELRASLQGEGAVFVSDTDSEVISQWLHRETMRGTPFLEAFFRLPTLLKGSYAIVALQNGAPETLYALRHGSPLVIGLSEGENWVGSDTLALAGCANQGIFLKDGEGAVITRETVQVLGADGTPTPSIITAFQVSEATVDKGEYAHFMLKEIYEQPDVIRRTITHYYDADSDSFRFDGLKVELAAMPALTIVACGTSFFAAQVASYWLEQMAKIPVRIDIASEFRYRTPVLPEGGVAMFISQSGETADTLAAMRYASEAGQHTVALVNVISSTMARAADSVIQTLAGAEIGVASTKAFTAQLATLAALVLEVARAKGHVPTAQYADLKHGLGAIADVMEVVLQDTTPYDQLARALMYARDMLFIGRGTSYPLAHEGALKMKEISYIHAEGYAAGELKHGPIALVDDGVPIIVIAPDDALFEKTASNLEETAARKGNIVLISSVKRIAEFKGNMTHSISVPECHPFHAPLLYALPLQLLSYFVALHKGADIDQPRNLAKSVTVE